MPQCNDLPEFKESRRICRDINLEDELNDLELLKKIYVDTFGLIGISPQPISADLLVEKEGEIILRYAAEEKINAQKVVTLLSKKYERTEMCRILGRTATCLMEEWGLIPSGLKIP